MFAESAQLVGSPATVSAVSLELNINVEKTLKSADNDEVKAADMVPDSKDNGIAVIDEPISSKVSEDDPKKSYASIVSSETRMSNTRGKKSTASRQEKVYVPANTKRASPKLAPEKPEKKMDSDDHPSVPETLNTSDIAVENSNQPEEDKMVSDKGMHIPPIKTN